MGSTSNSFHSGQRRSSMGGAHYGAHLPLLPLFVLLLVGFLSSENTAGTNNGRSSFLLLVQAAAEDNGNMTEFAGPGACYDLTVHQCNCNTDSCTAELCEANSMIWTADCPEHCAPEDCPTASYVVVTTGSNTTTEDVIPVVLAVPIGSGACYDLKVHQCNCNTDSCTAELCEANSMIWTADCPDHCDPEVCPATSSSSTTTTSNTTTQEETSEADVDADDDTDDGDDGKNSTTAIITNDDSSSSSSAGLCPGGGVGTTWRLVWIVMLASSLVGMALCS